VFCVQLISVPRLCTDSWCHVYKTGFTYWLHDCREGSHLSQSVTTVCFLKTCRSVSLCLVLQFILCWQQQVEWICITMNMYYNECDFVHFGDHLENWPTLWVLVMMCYINLCLLTYLLVCFIALLVICWSSSSHAVWTLDALAQLINIVNLHLVHLLWTVSNVKIVQCAIFRSNPWTSNWIKCVWSKGCH